MKLFYCCFLALFLLLPAAPARAQFLWQRAVGTAAQDETAEFMAPVAGGFVTLGRYVEWAAPFGVGLFLSKVDYAGDTLWTRRWPLRRAGALYPRGLFADGAGNLVASATTFGPPATPSAPAPPSEGRLVKFTAQGDTLWTRAVSAPSNAALDVPVLGNDGNYVVTGDFGISLPTLFKFSPAGALLWTQPVFYDNVRSGYLQNMVAVPNGYLLFSASNSTGRGKFILVNEQGVYQRERLGPYYGPARLQLDSQGNVFAIGGSLTKLNAQGDSLWSRTYQQFGALLGLTRLVELPNGRYLAAGERYNGPTRDVGLVVVDRNGTLLRDTLFVRNGGDENLAGVALTPAGHYVVALGASPGPFGRADQFLFAYRNWNRLLPARARPPEALAYLSAYPNPATDAVTLEAADARPLAGRWTLYDMLGRAVQAGTLPGLPRWRLSLAGQPAGLYLLRVSDERRGTTQTLRLEKRF